jgi:predicted lipoprotein with Yx(FWY)xxD motif
MSQGRKTDAGRRVQPGPMARREPPDDLVRAVNEPPGSYVIRIEATGLSPERGHAMNKTWLAPAGLAATLMIAACGSSSTSASSGSAMHSTAAPASSAPAAGSSALKTATIGGATVLTNAKGFTLYWFAPDTPATSKCNGSCATFWPPVKGSATTGAGVTGKLATIKRSDGSVQATYNGHPLYTYKGDTAPGQAKGNGLNLSGGVWHEVTTSGTAAPAPSTSASSGGGGYGY